LKFELVVFLIFRNNQLKILAVCVRDGSEKRLQHAAQEIVF
jgi:hypothetical protein